LFANASWVFNVSDAITLHGLGGPSLQDVFTTPTRTIDPSRLNNNSSMMFWADRTAITETLGARLFPEDDDDNGGSDGSSFTTTVVVHRASHTSVWQWPILWQMLVYNPMSILKDASPDDVERAKTATRAMVTTNDDDNEPVVLSSISNLTICRRRGGPDDRP
jgi:hypothetical protein